MTESYALFRWINNAHSPLGDVFFGLITGLGDGLIIALLCALLMLFRLRLGMAAMLAFIVSGLLAQLLKRMFDMPRPPVVLDHVHVLGHALTSHSFPSGHAASDGVLVLAAFLLWSNGSQAYKDWRSWLIATLFVLAAIGRIYVGVHFPLDVGVGLALGVLSMWGCWLWSRSWPVAVWQSSPWSWKISGFLVAVLAAVLGLGYHVQPSTAQPLALTMPIAALFILMHVWKGKLERKEE